MDTCHCRRIGLIMTENNDNKIKLALEFIKEEKVLIPGFYGTAGINLKIEDGNIQKVETFKIKNHK